jgi:hypothetical protein
MCCDPNRQPPVSRLKFLRMTSDETQQFKDLCTQIVAEKDPERYADLVRQLDSIMDAKEKRLYQAAQPRSKAS